MEAPEKGKTAESCAWFFQNANPTGSTHLCIDDNSIVQSVPFDHEAAGARGRLYRGKTVNDWAVHFEHAGYARQTPAEWADQYSQSNAVLVRDRRGERVQRLRHPGGRVDAVGLRSGAKGITTHAAVSAAFKVSGGHTDPGPGVPMARYVSAVADWLPKA